MPAATQTFQLFDSHANVLPVATITVPASAMDDLQVAIRDGTWWCDPENPQDQRLFTGIVRYVVSSP